MTRNATRATVAHEGVVRDVGVVAPLGALAVIVITAAMSPMRVAVGQTNAALVLVLGIVAAASVGGRVAGVTTALAGALSFNFFFTQPFLTLRIADPEDMVRVALLLVVGLAVGELTVLRARRSRSVSVGAANARRVQHLAGLLREGADADTVWQHAQRAVAEVFAVPISHVLRAADRARGLDAANLVTGSAHSRFVDGGFVTDAAVVLPLRRGSRRYGAIVVDDIATPTTWEDRSIATALADLLAVALALDETAPAGGTPSTTGTVSPRR